LCSVHDDTACDSRARTDGAVAADAGGFEDDVGDMEIDDGGDALDED